MSPSTIVTKTDPEVYDSCIFLQYTQTDEFLDEPFWFRVFYIVPMFTVFRTRLYIAFLLSECMCMTAGLGGYPVASKPRCGQGPSDLQALDDV